jgi:hypothetical protein
MSLCNMSNYHVRSVQLIATNNGSYCEISSDRRADIINSDGCANVSFHPVSTIHQ